MRAGGGGGHHVNIEKEGGGGHLLITWPGGGRPYRNFDLSNIFFPPPPPPPPFYINNDRSLIWKELSFSRLELPHVLTWLLFMQLPVKALIGVPHRLNVNQALSSLF